MTFSACTRPSAVTARVATVRKSATDSGSSKAARAVALWRSVEQDRKKGWRVVAALGPVALIGAVLRVRTLDQTLASIGRRLGLDIRKVELANPLAAVDVDKPSDHELVTAILEGRT